MKLFQKDLIFTSSDGKSKDDLQSELYEKHKFIDTLSKVKSNLHIEEGITRKELKKIESDTGICPTCKRAYDESHLNEIIDENISIDNIQPDRADSPNNIHKIFIQNNGRRLSKLYKSKNFHSLNSKNQSYSALSGLNQQSE